MNRYRVYLESTSEAMIDVLAHDELAAIKKAHAEVNAADWHDTNALWDTAGVALIEKDPNAA